MKKIFYDLAVIGSGPGGYVAAIRASQLGKKVVVIEKSDLGGICLNWGCIPTKSILRSAEIYDYFKDLNKFGLDARNFTFNLKKIIKRSRAIAGQLSTGIDYLFKKNNVNVIKGIAKINDEKHIIVSMENKNDILIDATKILLATGAKPKSLPFISAFNENIWSYFEALNPPTIPESIGIIGSGAIGIEFASFFNSMGSQVTVFEFLDRVLPSADKDVSKSIDGSLSKKGIKLFKNTNVYGINQEGKLTLKTKTIQGNNETKKDYSFEKILVAVGVEGNISNLGLENTNVQTENNHIKINSSFKTHDDKIYAIGDVVGAPWLAHKASHEGILCVNRLYGSDNISKDPNHIIPTCIYSHPQIASVGITEDQALAKNIKIKVGNFPLSANGKALSLSNSEGFVKTIFDADTGEILGAHMVGAEVTELINTFALAIKLEATEEDIFNTIFPHPTISESIHESALDAFNRAIHI